MDLVREPLEFQSRAAELRAAGKRLGFVPTMGALHRGHMALVETARQHGEVVAVSVFVNPTQFGPNEDLARYPRTLDSDLEQCRAAGVDLVFAPEAGAMYLPGEQTRVSVGAMANGLCGASRPNHFSGVCTVVSKLFALVGPSTAVFGRKDYQQWKILERMTQDLFLPIRVVSRATEREADGLALSSRNLRLSADARERALGLVKGLSRAQRAFERGVRNADELEGVVRGAIEASGLRVDYASCVDADSLERFDGRTKERALLATAAFADDVRLIDNVVLGEEPPLGVP
jgi:pantoate--beta-alanine ligase